MSADNYIYIQKTRRGKSSDSEDKSFESEYVGYKVWNCIASCICHHPKHCLVCQKFHLIGKTKTLGQALSLANSESSEYGFTDKLWCK